jgi:hypothetical protein
MTDKDEILKSYDELETSMANAIDPQTLAAVRQGLGSKFLMHRDELLQDIKERKVKACIAELRFLTETLEALVRMESAVLIGSDTSTVIRSAIAQISHSVAQFFSLHRDALNVVLPEDNLRELDPLMTRFARAVNQFDAVAVKFINALEKYEALKSTGPTN